MPRYVTAFNNLLDSELHLEIVEAEDLYEAMRMAFREGDLKGFYGIGIEGLKKHALSQNSIVNAIEIG